ncbi:ATPase [Alcanivorax sp. N3-2A]|nr:ATPase [Alcanivorax sp. N3-2A]
MISMGRRLGLSLFISLLLAGVLVGQAALWWLDQEQRDTVAAQLNDEATSVLAALVEGRDGLALQQQMLDPAYRNPFSGRYFVVLIGEQRWRSRSLWDANLDVPEAGGTDSELRAGPGGQQLLRFRGDYSMAGQPITIVVAQDYTPQLDNFEDIKTAALAAWVVVLAGLALAQQWLIRRGLKPLNQARRQLEQLRGGERVELDENVAVELRPLVTEVNRLQRHTEQQLRRSRHALGDLGHALKTPLAVLRNRCDERLQAADPALHALLDEQLDQLETSVRRALSRARVAAGATTSNRFNPAEDVPLLVATLKRAHHRDLNVEVSGQGLPPQPVERDDMLEVLGNLLDNAFKWARHRVWLGLEQRNGELLLSVADDGPGVAAERRHLVLRRGERLDQRMPGHGLGLAIVSDTVDAYGGRLMLSESDAGGLLVRIVLPVADRGL